MGKKRSSGPRKRIPQRVCVACRQSFDKRELTRLVRNSESSSVQIDLSGKANGRGAYLCGNRECWERAVRSDILNQALRTTLTPEDRERIKAAMP